MNWGDLCNAFQREILELSFGFIRAKHESAFSLINTAEEEKTMCPKLLFYKGAPEWFLKRVDTKESAKVRTRFVRRVKRIREIAELQVCAEYIILLSLFLSLNPSLLLSHSFLLTIILMKVCLCLFFFFFFFFFFVCVCVCVCVGSRYRLPRRNGSTRCRSRITMTHSFLLSSFITLKRSWMLTNLCFGT